MLHMRFATPLALAAALVPASVAAQPAPTPPPDDPPPSDPATADPAAPAPDPNTPPVAATPTTGIARWPLAIIERPLTLRRGLIRVQGDLGFAQVTTVDAAGEASTDTAIGLTLSGGYGLSDQLEVGIAYGLSLRDFEAKGPLTLLAAFQLADGDFKAAVNAAFSYNLATEIGTLSGGLAAQYNVTSELSLFTPGQQLSTVVITEAESSAVSLALPLGIGLQAAPQIFAYAQSTIASINLSDETGSNIFEDAINVVIGAFYSPSSEVDLGAAIVIPDVDNAADTIAFVITGRIFAM